MLNEPGIVGLCVILIVGGLWMIESERRAVAHEIRRMREESNRLYAKLIEIEYLCKKATNEDTSDLESLLQKMTKLLIGWHKPSMSECAEMSQRIDNTNQET